MELLDRELGQMFDSFKNERNGEKNINLLIYVL